MSGRQFAAEIQRLRQKGDFLHGFLDDKICYKWYNYDNMHRIKKPIVYVAMSGGVDSSVTAALLKERGFDVRGVHIKIWSDPRIPCRFKEDRYDAYEVAEHIGIPFETWDFTEEYKRAVVEYLIREYAAGRTPNPDVMCNRHIKFGIFLQKALERGADHAATGHYVRKVPEFSIFNFQFSKKEKRYFENSKIENSLKIENCKLKIAKDTNKDQSYFLWTLTQEQLKHVLFPIGEYTKPEVREMARRFGLPTAAKKDSQGICFMGEIDIRDFLKEYIPVRTGLVATTSGEIIGQHEGLAFYTIGQREGIGIGGGIPYYVAEKNFGANTLIVAQGPYDEKLFSQELSATDVNWISGHEPRMPFRCEARIRYRQPLQQARIMNYELGIMEKKTNTKNSIIHNSRFIIHFDEPQRAVTPGQSVVFYQNREMLGGGCIM